MTEDEMIAELRLARARYGLKPDTAMEAALRARARMYREEYVRKDLVGMKGLAVAIVTVAAAIGLLIGLYFGGWIL